MRKPRCGGFNKRSVGENCKQERKYQDMEASRGKKNRNQETEASTEKKHRNQDTDASKKDLSVTTKQEKKKEKQ